MKTLKIIFSTALFLSLLSCGPRVDTSQPTNADLSKYESFAYLPNTNAEVPNKNYNDEDINSVIIQSINRNLEQEGYDLDRQNPDLLVLVSTKTDTETAVDSDPLYATYPYTSGMTRVTPYYNSYYYSGYSGYSNVVGYDTDTYSYEEGTLIVQLVDSETKNTVWKGVASNNIYEQSSTAGIQDMVDDIFEKYPMNK